MSGIVLLLVVGGIAGLGILVLVSVYGRGDQDQDPDTGDWTRVNAEVVSVLRTRSSAFLLVRYTIGTTLIRTDVLYPLPGPVPRAGRRVPIRFDPVSPTRAMFDLQPDGGTRKVVARPA
ncbi:MAG TPA: hypothetical protein VFI00_19100 [Kribbella sp.]|nr:hypothetical protein [Kribbella sp.]